MKFVQIIHNFYEKSPNFSFPQLLNKKLLAKVWREVCIY